MFYRHIRIAKEFVSKIEKDFNDNEKLSGDKSMRTIFIACFILVNMILLISGCGNQGPKLYVNFNETEKLEHPAPVNRSAEQPLKLAVSPVLPQKETIGYYRQIAEHLAIQTGRPTELIQRQSNLEVSVLLANGGADIAFFSTGAYTAYEGAAELEALVAQQRNGVPFYHSFVIVAKESNINSFPDLEGKSFAFTDTLSFSGYIFPSYLLKSKGKTPEQFFSRYLFTYNHTKSLRAVADKVVDGAAIDSLVYERAQENTPELADAVRIIATSMPLGTGPVVVKKDMERNQKDLLRSIFLNMHYNADMRQTLKGLGIERFVEYTSKYYEYPSGIVGEKRTRL